MVVTHGFLIATFAQVTDLRRRQGTRYSLAVILALAVVAIIANHLSVSAIAQWGAEEDRTRQQALGFRAGATPHQSTLQRLFGKLDPDQLGSALSQACALRVPPPARRGSQGVAVDGKAQRGRLAAEPAAGVIRALTAFCHEQQIVLSQVPITTSAAKAEAELTVVPEIIAALDWRGRIFTGDAPYCQRAVCQQVLERGGDYLILVKENQRTLFTNIPLLFEPSDAPPLGDRREARTHDNGHGRHHETRHLIASTDLVGYLDWPGHAQGVPFGPRWKRTWQEKDTDHRVVRYEITSLPPENANPARLLALKRGHWRSENSLHRPKHVALGEDASLIHTANGPDVLAILRNLALSLLHAAGIHTIAAQLRHFSAHPEEVLQFVLAFSTQNASTLPHHEKAIADAFAMWHDGWQGPAFDP